MNEPPRGPIKLQVNEYRVFQKPPRPPQIFSLELGDTTFVVLDLEKKKVIGIVHNSPHIARLVIPKDDDYVSVEIVIKNNMAEIQNAIEVSDDISPTAQFNGKAWGPYIRRAVIDSTTNGGGNGAGTSSYPSRLLDMK